MSILLYEDELVSELYPITLARPAFAITCGGVRLIDQLSAMEHVWCLVRPHLQALVEHDFTAARLWEAGCQSPESPLLIVNARVIPAAETIAYLQVLFQQPPRTGAMVRVDNELAVALVPPSLLKGAPHAGGDVADWVGSLGLAAEIAPIRLFQYPHEVVSSHMATLLAHIGNRATGTDLVERAPGVFVAGDAQVDDSVVFNTTLGPIVIEAECLLRPHGYLQGPAWIGRQSQLMEHASVRQFTSIGQTCKIGGEVAHCIVESYTNKPHAGYLGHSYVGSWVNLGAGTSNSDLKNTYGSVTMKYHGRRVSTGMQFMGCVIGDFTKTAINTALFTGKTIGACSMVYGFVTENVPSFCNYARHLGQVTASSADVIVKAQQRMFDRRNVPQRACDIGLIREIHRLTEKDRLGLEVMPLAL